MESKSFFFVAHLLFFTSQKEGGQSYKVGPRSSYQWGFYNRTVFFLPQLPIYTAIKVYVQCYQSWN